MKRIVLALLVTLTLAAPTLACSMYDIPWPLPIDTSDPPITTVTPTPTPIPDPPPPPPVFADCPPILFETLGGREEPPAADTVVQWIEESCVLS